MRYWQRPLSAGLASSGAAAGQNVLLITLDTLRSDHLGCYGYDLVETPVIDRLAKEGVRFERAITAVPITLPSHCTIMTGLYPPAHGVRDNGTFRLVEEHQTLAEIFQAEGYATAAFLAAFVLDDRYGLSQGFDLYDDDLTLRHRLPTPNLPHSPERPADAVVDAAMAWLEAHQGSAAEPPFFLWVHLFDAHQPYAPPEPYRKSYAERPYDGEIAFVDQQLGRLMEGVKKLGLADNTITMIVGDHGESLGEHGEATHRQLIYGSTMRVPWIIHAPGTVTPHKVITNAVVGTVDVMPTILDLMGWEVPTTCHGRSALSGDLDPQRALYIESLSSQLNDGWAPLFGVRRAADKFIEAPTPEYFDLNADPDELDNLWTIGHDVAGVLAERLAEFQSAFPAPAESASVAPTAEDIRKLAALGYVRGEISGAGADLDPKVMIHTFNKRLAAINLMQQGRLTEAVAELKALIEQSPESAELWSLLGTAQRRAGQIAAAAESAGRAVGLKPNNPEYMCTLAEYLRLQGDTEGAEEVFASAERMEPGFGRLWLIRARSAMQAGLDDEALKHCQRAIEVDPVRSTAEALALSGRIHERQEQNAQAKSDYDAALEHDPYQGMALLGRGKLAIREGDREQAMNYLTTLIDGQPEYVEGGRLLGQLYFETGNYRVSGAIFSALIQRNPRDGEAHFGLSRVLAARKRTDAALNELERAAKLGAVDFQRVRSDRAFQELWQDPRLKALEQKP